VQVGIGVTYLSGTDDILTGAVAQKQFLFGPALNPLSLKLKAQADYNTQTQQVTSIAMASNNFRVHLTHIGLDCSLVYSFPLVRRWSISSNTILCKHGTSCATWYKMWPRCVSACAIGVQQLALY
jgi:hypothetical protein